MTDINETLAQREQTHGKFEIHASICQALTGLMRSRHGWDKLADDQREALEMIAHKIAGYATLVANELNNEVE